MTRAITLLYHDVVPAGQWNASGFQSPDAHIYKLESGEFGKHLRAIADAAAHPPARVTDMALPQRPLFLSFDDGGESAIRHIAPALAEFGWPGHFFVTTDMIGRRGFLTPSQIRDLRDQGHVIGSHSCSHPLRMAACPDAHVRREWSRSAATLAEILGEPVITASIPGGHYSRAVAGAAAEAGIRFLFTSEPVVRCHTIDGCLVLGRFGVQRGIAANWAGAVARGAMKPRVEQYLFWNFKKALKRIGGERWLQFRRAVLARGREM